MIRAPVAGGNDGWLTQSNPWNSNPRRAYTLRGAYTLGALPMKVDDSLAKRLGNIVGWVEYKHVAQGYWATPSAGRKQWIT